jgi:hypothetical protein
MRNVVKHVPVYTCHTPKDNNLHFRTWLKCKGIYYFFISCDFCMYINLDAEESDQWELVRLFINMTELRGLDAKKVEECIFFLWLRNNACELRANIKVLQ